MSADFPVIDDDLDCQESNHRLPLSSLVALSGDDLQLAILAGVNDILIQTLQDRRAIQAFNSQELLSSPITALGVDSLASLEMRNEISDWVDVDIPGDIIVGGGTVADVIEKIHQYIMLLKVSASDETLDQDAEEFVL